MWPWSQLNRIEETLADLRAGQHTLKGRTFKIMALLDDVVTAVSDERTVVDSAITLLTDLKARLDAAGTDPVKLQAIKDALGAQKTDLANAVVANTPSAP